METVKPIAAAFAVVGFACVLLFFAIVAAEAHQPQPRMDPGEDWVLLEFDSGAQWYIDETKVSAVHAIPREDSRKLGYKTVIFGPGWKVHCPWTVEEIAQRGIYGGDPPFKHPENEENE